MIFFYYKIWVQWIASVLQMMPQSCRHSAIVKIWTNGMFSVFQIVRQDRTMEQIVFPIPEICEYLTEETKVRTLATTERDDQGSKITDYFEHIEDMFAEMKWQKKLRGKSKVQWS